MKHIVILANFVDHKISTEIVDAEDQFEACRKSTLLRDFIAAERVFDMETLHELLYDAGFAFKVITLFNLPPNLQNPAILTPGA